MQGRDSEIREPIIKKRVLLGLPKFVRKRLEEITCKVSFVSRTILVLVKAELILF